MVEAQDWVDHASIGEWNKVYKERGRGEITGGFLSNDD